jgi:hypothetical protein
MPRATFDCLNWLAQDLFRNNPGHLISPTSSQAYYLKRMKEVSTQLKQRIEDTRLAREAEILRIEEEKIAKAIELRRQVELAEMMRRAKLRALKSQFEELLSSVLEVWMDSINRLPSGVLYLNEIIEVYETLSKSNDIQSEPAIYRNLLEIL